MILRVYANARSCFTVQFESVYVTLPGLAAPQPLPQPIVSARHILLPFDLAEDPGSFTNSFKCHVLAGIFPEAKISLEKIGPRGGFLVLQFSTLPPKPWPHTVAGVPAYFMLASRPRKSPRAQGVGVPPNNAVYVRHMDFRAVADWRQLFAWIEAIFARLGVPITEVMYWEDHVVIVLESCNADLSALPRAVANVECRYLCEQEMRRPPHPTTYRDEDETPGSPDEARYATLRPGVRISSPRSAADPDNFYRTTAGVLVKDSHGAEFLTIASHGFAGRHPRGVLHPLGRDHACIGAGVHDVDHTGFGLVKLRDGAAFVNDTFQGEGVPRSVHLKRFAPVMGRPRNEAVFMDSPDTGCLEGSSSVTSFQRVPGDDPEAGEHRWILTSWFYMGQNMEVAIPDGASGSAVWTEDGDVLGFFRYAPRSGPMKRWASCIAADELMSRFLSLADTAGRPEKHG